jgi:predicted nucleic acid-binding protein
VSRRRKRTRAPVVPKCVLDSGGLTALIGRSARARALLEWMLEHDGSVLVPTPVLVETVTGDSARDAEINRILAALDRAGSFLAIPDEGIARAAGRLRFRARTDDGIDALVAAEAAREGAPCVLLTSDPDDLARLLTHEPQVAIRVV